MTTVYLVRHGTTDFNVYGKFQGSMDVPLNALGLEQARYLGVRFREVPLDAVYSSPLCRALRTAEGICAHHALSPILCEGLREIDGGLLEGRTGEENLRRFPLEMAALRDRPSRFAAPQGESARQVYDRVVAAITGIVAENPGGTLAVVAHGFVIQTYISYARREPFETFRRFIVGNTAVSTLCYERPEEPELLYCGDDSHLPEQLRFVVATNFLKK